MSQPDDYTPLASRTLLIVGGGPAGLQAACAAADAGLKVILMERTEHLGGHLQALTSLAPSTTDPQVLLRQLTGRLASDPAVQGVPRAELLSLEGHLGNFVARLLTDRGVEEHQVGAAILAPGCDTHPRPQWEGLAGSAAALTLRDLEQYLADWQKGKWVPPERIAFLMDWGADDPLPIWTAALRAALLLREEGKRKVWVIGQQVKVAQMGGEELYHQARQAGVVFGKHSGELKVALTESGLDLEFSEATCGSAPAAAQRIVADLLVIPPLLVPSVEAQRLWEAARITPGEDGFGQQENARRLPNHTSRRGVLVAGSGRGPMTVTEALADAAAAVETVCGWLQGEHLEISWDHGVVNEDKCILCLTCYRICPHQAVPFDPVADASQIWPAACWGCGLCVSCCPTLAIDMVSASEAWMRETAGGVATSA